jgi:NADPH:quinone reductase-like Zn-dependent oxidoreductase
MPGPALALKGGPGEEARAMKRVVVDHYGGPEVLKVVDEDDPRPGPGEVRVKVLAAGCRLPTPSCARARTSACRRPRSHPALPVGGGPRDPEWFGEDFRVLLDLLRTDKIHPVVAERLPLSDARRAHELLESSASKGKLVLVP